jgi:hypothetical protein
MKTALLRKVGRATVLVHPSGAMPDDDWRRIQDELRALPPPRPDERMVIWADGTINANQRRAAKDNERVQRVVMFTGSLLTRGVMQALSWMGMNVAAFSKVDVDDGLAKEGFSAAEIAEVKAAIADLERELGVGR